LITQNIILLNDLKQALQMSELWMRMGMNEIRRGYRRTIIGPFWMTISMCIFISFLGFMYSGFWKVDITTYLPYLCVGFVCWAPITSTIKEGCTLFISNQNIIKQIHPPYCLFALVLIYRQLILFCHHMVIFLILVLLMPVEVNINTFLFVPGLFILLINGIWVTMLMGLINTRYRDIQPLVSSIMQLMFFMTPIFWMPEFVSERKKIFIDTNPFYHLIEIVRDPLLGSVPAPESYVYVLFITIFGWLFTIKLFSVYERRITYWL